MCPQTLDRPPPTRSKRRGRPPGASSYQEPIEGLLDTYLDELMNDGRTWLSVLATHDGVAVLTALMAPAFREELAHITDPEERRELRRAWVQDARDFSAKSAKRFRGVSIESRRKTLRNYLRGRPGGKRSRPSVPVTTKLIARRLRHALEVLRSERELLGPDGP